MGVNFHTAYTTATLWKPEYVNPPLSDLDRAISYLKNAIIHCDGAVTYNALTGVLAWASTLRILFNRADGQAILNTVNAGNITLNDNEFAYVDLNETNNTVLSVSKAAVSTGSASNFILYNRLILGYRNTASDGYFPVYLHADPGVQALTSAASVTVDWSNGKTAKITLAHDVDFTFSGGIDGDKLVLRIKQNDTLAKTPTWPGTIRYGTDLTSIVIPTDLSKQHYLGFLYDGDASKYDFVSEVKGF